MQRLKTRPQFQAALAGGIIARTSHFALHRVGLDTVNKPPESKVQVDTNTPPTANIGQLPLFGVNDVWVGAMAPKRWAKRAVTRNAIKRQIYQVSQGFEPSFAKAAYVVRLRTGFDGAKFASATSAELKAQVRRELNQLFAQAGLAP